MCQCHQSCETPSFLQTTTKVLQLPPARGSTGVYSKEWGTLQARSQIVTNSGIAFSFQCCWRVFFLSFFRFFSLGQRKMGKRGKSWVLHP
jgi:hypothetical protein